MRRRRPSSYRWHESAARQSLRAAGLEPANAKRTGMSPETRLERRLDRAVDRATTPRGAAVVIASTTIVITFAAGILMRVIDREHYPSIGSGLWWAVQTTTTVGYGDNVPTTVGGRLLAALVMLFGIGFITVITAAITSTFVTRSRLEQKALGCRDAGGRADASVGQAARTNRSRRYPFLVGQVRSPPRWLRRCSVSRASFASSAGLGRPPA